MEVEISVIAFGDFCGKSDLFHIYVITVLLFQCQVVPELSLVNFLIDSF